MKYTEIRTLSLQNTAVVNPLNARGEPFSEFSRRLLEKEGAAFRKELQQHLRQPGRFRVPIVTKRHEQPPALVLHVSLQYQHPVLQCEVIISYFDFNGFSCLVMGGLKDFVFPAGIEGCSEKMPGLLSGQPIFLNFFSSKLVTSAAC